MQSYVGKKVKQGTREGTITKVEGRFKYLVQLGTDEPKPVQAKSLTFVGESDDVPSIKSRSSRAEKPEKITDEGQQQDEYAPVKVRATKETGKRWTLVLLTKDKLEVASASVGHERLTQYLSVDPGLKYGRGPGKNGSEKDDTQEFDIATCCTSRASTSSTTSGTGQSPNARRRKSQFGRRRTSLR